MQIENLQEKIILAIDGLDLKEAVFLLNKFQKLKWIKVGLELFTKEGPQAIKVFKDMDKNIFLDLKFHDIPNTMKSACYEASKLEVDMISVHASAGINALRASKLASLEGANEINKKAPELIGVTVLTSFSSEIFKRELNRQTSIEENVLRLAKLSYDAGLDGCVCSPFEVQNIRKYYKNNFKLITPGIRIDKNKHDQSRVMTPYDALSNGASQLVIGRSITQSKNPNQTLLDILNSIRNI